MKARWGICLAVVFCVVGVALWLSTSPTVAHDPLVTVAAVTTPMSLGVESKFSYVGSKACKKCHLSQHKSWSKSKLAKALETLQPGKSVEAKKKHGLDPEKDYTKDEACIKCHVTGFGAEGGYVVPDAGDKKSVKKAKTLEGVGCEACHGPGSEYSKLFKEIQKSKRTYKVDEVYAAGLTKVEEAVCVKCHNDKSPTYTEPFKFDLEEAKKVHDHKELKQREG